KKKIKHVGSCVPASLDGPSIEVGSVTVPHSGFVLPEKPVSLYLAQRLLLPESNLAHVLARRRHRKDAYHKLKPSCASFHLEQKTNGLNFELSSRLKVARNPSR
ncbi:uncharacterized protein PgNI_04779, partial [Pyricularia grisea]|uniref:Uncharacterized protein n=1 Tax=Pyricularia grisea TaxID=148305 RepID=A0A6P8BCR4_PYRGI